MADNYSVVDEYADAVGLSELKDIYTTAEPISSSGSDFSDIYNSGGISEQDVEEAKKLGESIRRKQYEIKRAKELKEKEIYRTTDKELQRNSDGSLETDSDLEIRAKQAVNAISSGVDWLLEATAKVYDAGQGSWLDNAKIDAVINGKDVNMGNKDIIAARNTTLEELVNQYNSAEDDPYAEERIYTLRKFDGYDELGREKYLYKYGVTNVSAAHRYKDQWVRDGFEIVEEKGFNGAGQWEKTLQALTESLNARALDYGGVKGPDGKYMSTDEASGVGFGSGYTELYNRDLLGIDFGKTEEDYAENLVKSEALKAAYEASGYHDRSVWGRTKNTVKAGVSMFAQVALVDTVDWLAEVTGLGDLGTEEEKREYTQKFFGYDSYFADKAMKRVERSVSHMMENGVSLSKVREALGDSLTNFETTGESVGFLLGMVIGGGKFSKTGQALSKINKFEKASIAAGKSVDAAKTLAEARRAKVLAKSSATQRATYELSRQAGYINTVMGQTSNHIDEYKENNNGVGPDLAGTAFIIANNFVQLGVDRFADLSVLRSAGILKLGKDSIKDIAKKHLPETAAAVAATTVKLARSMGIEFAQEYYQTMSEEINQRWGTDKYGNSLMDIITSQDVNLQSIVAGFAGAGGAAHFHTVGLAPSLYNYAKGEKDETEVDQRIADLAENQGVTETEAKVSLFEETLGENSGPQEIQDAIDTTYEPAQPLVDDSGNIILDDNGMEIYNPEDVAQNIKSLFTNFLDPFTKRFERAANGELEAKDLKLGTARAALNQFIKATNKMANADLTDDQQALFDTAKQTIANFKHNFYATFENKVNAYSIAELDAMSDDQAQKEFGSMFGPDGPTQEEIANLEKMGAELSGLFSGSKKKNKSKKEKTTDTTDTTDTENIVDIINAKAEESATKSIVELFNEHESSQDPEKVYSDIISNKSEEKLEKLSKVADKTGNKEASKAFKKEAEKKKQQRLTLEQLKDKKLFDDNKGFVSRVAKAMATSDYEKSLQDKMDEANAFLYEWLVSEGAINQGDVLEQSVVDDFLAPGSTKWNRDQYYKKINSTPGLLSIHDVGKKLQKIKDQNNKLRQEIADKINYDIDRVARYEEVIDEMIEEIKNGDVKKVPVKNKRHNEIKNKLNKSTEPQFASDAFRRPYENSKGTDGKNDGIKIYYKDVENFMKTGERKEIFKLIDTIDQEIEIMFSLIEDENAFQITGDAKKGLEGKKEKEAKAEKKAKEKVIDTEDKENQAVILTAEQLEKERVKLKKHKAMLDKLNAKIARNDKNLSIDVGTPLFVFKDKSGKQFNGTITGFTGSSYTVNYYDDNMRKQTVTFKNGKSLDGKFTGERVTEEAVLKQVQIDAAESLKGVGPIIKDAFKSYLSYKNNIIDIYNNSRDATKGIKEVQDKIKKLEAERQKLLSSLRTDPNLKKLSDKELRELSEEKKVKRISAARKLIAGIKRFIAGVHALFDSLLSVNKELDKLYKERDDIRSAIKTRNSAINKEQKKADAIADKVYHATHHKVDLDQEEKKAIRKYQSPKKSRKLIQNAIKRIEKKIMFPHESANILLTQASRPKTYKKENNQQHIPDTVADYVQVRKKSSSLFSSMPIDMIAPPGSKLNQWMEDGIDFVLSDNGLHTAITNRMTSGYLDIFSPAMTFLSTRKTISDKPLKRDEINKNFVAAIVVATNEVIRNSSSTLYSRSDADIARLLGKKEFQLTSEEKEMFRHKTRVGNLSNDLGDAIMDLMDLKEKSSGDREAFARFRTNAGLIAIEYAIHKGYLVLDNSMTLKEYRELLDMQDDDPASSKKTVNFVSRPKDKDGVYKDWDKKFVEGIKKDLELMRDDNNKLIPVQSTSTQFSPPRPKTVEEREVRGNPYLSPTRAMAKALNGLEQQEHNALLDANEFIFSEDADKALELEKAALKAFKIKFEVRKDGTLDTDTPIDKDDEKYYDDKEATKAAARSLHKEYREYVSLMRQLANGEKPNTMWFNWFTPMNGRLNINSVLIDPQNSKEFHRWLILPKNVYFDYSKKALDAIDPKDESTFNEYTGFYLGVAQAFGFDIDKFAIGESIEYARKVMDLSVEDIQKEYIDKREFDHYGHAIQALTAIKKYKDSKSDVFNAGITAEFDGITNGTILKVMQIPLMADSAAILLKGGIATKGYDHKMKGQLGVNYDNFTSPLPLMGESKKIQKEDEKRYEEHLANGGTADTFKRSDVPVLDTYFSGAVNADLSAKKVFARMTDDDGKIVGDRYGLVNKKDPEKNYIMDFIPDSKGILTKAIRDMFKYPTMIINYGGSLKSVEKRVAAEVTASMLTKLLKDYTNKKKDQKAYDRAVEILGKIAKKHEVKVSTLVKQLRTKPLYQITYTNSHGQKFSIEESLNSLFLASVGQAVSGAIDEMFGPMIRVTNTVNDSSRNMFRTFERAFEHDLKQLIDSKKKSKNDKWGISKDEMNELIKKLKPLLPLYEGPGSVDKFVDGIAVFTTKTVDTDDMLYDNASIKKVNKGGKVESLTARAFVKKIAESYAAAGVLPTHTTDGLIMAETINEIISQYGITPIHDAIAIGGKNVADILKIMNNNMGQISLAYDSINAVAISMREMYDYAAQYEKDSGIKLNLDEMRTAEEIKEEKKWIEIGVRSEYDEKSMPSDADIKAEVDARYTPISFYDKLVEMEQTAEKVWMAKKRLTANDMKFEQYPGHDGMVEIKAKYSRDDMLNELDRRIKRRVDDMQDISALGSDLKKLVVNESSRKLALRSLLNIKFNGKDTMSDTQKINYNLDIIDIITDALNGVC